MPLKPKLTAIKKELAKLLTSAPVPGQGAGWLGLWRFIDITDAVKDVLPRYVECFSAVATAYVVGKEAERLGIASEPGLVSALTELRQWIAAASAPPAGLSWEERSTLHDIVRDASCKAAMVIIDAWGVPSGLIGPRPPGGRPPHERTVMPAWFAELATAAPEGAPQ